MNRSTEIIIITTCCYCYSVILHSYRLNQPNMPELQWLFNAVTQAPCFFSPVCTVVNTGGGGVCSFTTGTDKFSSTLMSQVQTHPEF